MSTKPKIKPAIQTPSPISYVRPTVLAERLGLHKKTLLRWADEGRIHRHKLGPKVVLFDEREVAEMLAASRIA